MRVIWPNTIMIFKQYYLGCLAHASYLIADEKTKIAAVVDPQRDIDEYLADADRFGVRVSYVLLTHFHADFVAGHLELRHRSGAQICLGAKAKARYQFRPLHDGEVVEFGDIRLKILETPGHTLEGISVVVYDLAKDSQKPHAVLTGDTLFIGDVGRPDLMASIGITAEELAGMLYDSLHTKLLALPDETLIYPAHGAGSMCGKNLSSDTVSTMGTQRWYNYALQPMSREDFVSLVTRDQPEAPRYFGYDAQLNRETRPTLDAMMEKSLRPLTLTQVLNLQRQGAQVVDVRDPADFAGGYLAGSVNIGLGGKFATWAGIILDAQMPIVIVAEPGRECEAIMRLGRIGFDQVQGYLADGMCAVAERPDLVRRVRRLTAGDLATELRGPNPPRVVDVRTEREWREDQIDHSMNIPLPHLQDRLEELPHDGVFVVHCASGYRSSIAVSLLLQKGFAEVMDLIGGYDAWRKTWNPKESRMPSSSGSGFEGGNR